MSEHDEQAAVVQRCEWLVPRYPELAMLYATPNGGLRDKRTGARLKAEGVKAGIPDLCLPVARGGYHGLYNEMKVRGRYPTPEQEEWLRALEVQGYHAVCCHGQDDACRVIADYLGIADL